MWRRKFRRIKSYAEIRELVRWTRILQILQMPQILQIFQYIDLLVVLVFIGSICYSRPSDELVGERCEGGEVEL